MSNQSGFSSVILGLIILIAIPIIIFVPGAIMRSAKERSIEKQIDGINFTEALQSKTCSAGDPIDSPEAWCQYIFSGTPSFIETALRDKGFNKTNSSTSPTQGGSTINISYSGGTPLLTIKLTSYNGTDVRYVGRTTLEARLANE